MTKIQVDLDEKQNEILNGFMFLHGIKNKREALKKLIEEHGKIKQKYVKVRNCVKKNLKI